MIARRELLSINPLAVSPPFSAGNALRVRISIETPAIWGILDICSMEVILRTSGPWNVEVDETEAGLPAAELNLQISIKSYLILHRYSCQWKIQEKIFPNK